MKQRVAFLMLMAGTLLISFGWAPETWAQATRRVGILAANVNLNNEYTRQWWEPFRRTLADQGWIEGKNVAFAFRQPSGDSPDFTKAAEELARLKVDAIWAISTPAVRAAFAATRTVPIVAID